jgi:hypothetical protein
MRKEFYPDTIKEKKKTCGRTVIAIGTGRDQICYGGTGYDLTADGHKESRTISVGSAASNFSVGDLALIDVVDDGQEVLNRVRISVPKKMTIRMDMARKSRLLTVRTSVMSFVMARFLSMRQRRNSTSIRRASIEGQVDK